MVSSVVGNLDDSKVYETSLLCFRVHLRIFDLKVYLFCPLRNPLRILSGMFKSHKIYSVNLCVVRAQYANSFV